MRKFSLLAAMAAVLALSSCSNDQELNSPQTTGEEIGFRTLIDKGGDTRATITKTDNILGFTVTAWWDKMASGGPVIGSQDSDEGGYLFNAFDITRREENMGMPRWDYSPKIYWPSKGNGVYFFAYSPASSKHVNTGLYNYEAITKLRYTVPDPGEDQSQEDFLLARTGQQTGGMVILNFAHALSRVKFYAKKNANLEHLNYLIKSVELMNIEKEGEIDLKDIPSNGDFDYTSGPLVLWESQLAPQGNINADLGESPVYVQDDGFKSILGETNALMVLPQKTVTGDPTNPGSDFLVKVEYKAFIDIDDPGTYYAGTQTSYDEVYFAVPEVGGVPFTFEIGRQYNFNLTFGTEAGAPVKFEVESVGEWSDAPPVDLPQITDYYKAGLISKALAEQVKADYATKGVSLGDILSTNAVTLGSNANTTTSASDVQVTTADLKGIEYFENLTVLNLNNTKNLELSLEGLNNLKTINCGSNVNFDVLDISAGLNTPLNINVEYRINLGESETDLINAVQIATLKVWDGFDATTSGDIDQKLSLCNRGAGSLRKGYVVITTVSGNTTIATINSSTDPTTYYK